MRKLSSHFLAATAMLSVSVPALAVTRYVLPATIQSSTNAALPGDQLVLSAPGSYGDLLISKKTSLLFTSPDRQAYLNTLRISASTGIHTDGVGLQWAFQPNVSVAEQGLIHITESKDVELLRGTFKGAVATTGVAPTATALDGSKNVVGLPSGQVILGYHVDRLRVAFSDVSQGYRGVQCLSCTNVTVEDSDVHDMRKSLIAVSVKDGFTVRRVHLWKMTPWGYTGNYDHADAVTNWTWAAEGQHTKNELLEDNLYEARDGQNTLGFYLMAHDGTYNWAHENPIMRRNIAITATYTAFYCERCVGGTMEGNVALMNPVKPTSMEPWVKLQYQNGQTITGNRLPRISWTTAPAGWLDKIKATNTIKATQPGEANAAVAAWLAKFRPSGTILP